MTEPVGSEGESAGVGEESSAGASAEPQAQARIGKPWDSESARAAAQRSAEVRRERSRLRAEAAARQGLTARQRIAEAVAGQLPQEDLDLLVGGLLAEALRAPGSPSSSRALRDLLELNREALGRTKGSVDEAPNEDGASWEELSPAQRAAHRAAWRQEQGLSSGDESDPRGAEPS